MRWLCGGRDGWLCGWDFSKFRSGGWIFLVFILWFFVVTIIVVVAQEAVAHSMIVRIAIVVLWILNWICISGCYEYRYWTWYRSKDVSTP